MKTKKSIQNLIILFLCLCILGFFANWAQNDYGMQLISYCMLAISLGLVGIAYIQIQHKKIFREFLLLSFSFLLVLIPINNSDLPQLVFISLAMIGIFGPTLLIPLLIALTEFKKVSKTNLLEYYSCVFLASFCIGHFYKIHHLKGAGPLLASSAFLIIPFLVRIIKLIRQGKGKFHTAMLAEIFLYFFIGMNLLGYIFIIQHWPGAAVIAYLSFSSLILMLLILIWMKYNRESARVWWLSQVWLTRVALICFTVTSLHFILYKQNLIPKFYSTEYPPALIELWAKSNDITPEGIKNDKKGEVYYENYINFLNARENSEQKLKGTK